MRAEIDGETFAYSGDTAWTPVLPRAADGAQLFACEAYTYDKIVPYHLSYVTVEEHLGEFGAERLVLTHLGPTMLARLDTVEPTVAEDGLVLRV